MLINVMVKVYSSQSWSQLWVKPEDCGKERAALQALLGAKPWLCVAVQPWLQAALPQGLEHKDVMEGAPLPTCPCGRSFLQS